jgi:predicted DNA-binding transcriptional regulator AlpA
MTAARPQPRLPEARILTSPRQVAARLGRSETWFVQHKAALEAAGFPRRDALLDGWDLAAIDAWIDRRAGALLAHRLRPALASAAAAAEDDASNPYDQLLGSAAG